MSVYNKEALLEDVDMMSICDALGIPTRIKSRNNIDILCPGHNDQRFGACKLKAKGCYCFACNKYYDVFEMVMLKNGANFKEAFEFIAEQTGPLDNYIENTKGIKKPSFPLTKEELDILKLKRIIEIKIPVGISDEKPEYKKGYTYEAEIDDDFRFTYVIEKIEQIRLDELLKNDPAFFKHILAVQIKKLMDFINSSSSFMAMSEWEQEVKVIENLTKKFNLSDIINNLDENDRRLLKVKPTINAALPF